MLKKFLVLAMMFVVPFFAMMSSAQALRMTIVDTQIDTPEVREYIHTLEWEKNRLLRLYPYSRWQVSDVEYDILAHIAIGILGRESKFFTSTRYKIKESAPWAVDLAKRTQHMISGKAISPNSRGGTQIKNIPDLVEEEYSIEPSELKQPRSCAVATMGFLIESLTQLKNQAKYRGVEAFGPSQYIDYLPYIYFGRSKRIWDGTATPNQNAYVIEMKADMKKVIMESF